MTEAEWKILRTVKEAALERLCDRIMKQCQAAIQGPGTSHERYLRLFQVVLAAMVKLRLVTDGELSRFEPGTQEFVRAMAAHRR